MLRRAQAGGAGGGGGGGGGGGRKVEVVARFETRETMGFDFDQNTLQVRKLLASNHCHLFYACC